MTITKTKENNVLTLSLLGRLDSSTAVELDDALKAEVTPELTALVLDMEGVDFISSRGLRVILFYNKELNGRSLRILHCNSAVMEIFRLSGLEKHLCFE